ncbi:asparagine synthase (glutamine-hydrolyzing) [Pannonibacter phragmitetus]|uniref:asparagine synthase (glutamine-hydrolyzing) n=1 Tax=Pannonibacter phragmitetus TaxID=121719 RepID=UPI003D2F253F
MCGVAGLIGRSADLSAIFEMTRVQAHRGPDGHGHLFVGAQGAKFVHNEGDGSPDQTHFAALGHLRLSILDCSEEAGQPMRLSVGDDWISYNGEVYNFIELRAELEALGYVFRTTGDTEVLLAAYREWGTDCFARFNGMWAILIWDARKGRFVISRDRFGVKPLHYAAQRGMLYLASEIKGILAAARDLPRRANRRAILEYLKFGTVNQSNETFFEDILAFPPGHFAVIDPADPERVSPKRFWDYTDPAPQDITQEEADAEFTRLLEDAVRIRMRSDVPVGSCLSGGLDSSAIVGLAAKGHEGNFHTFTSCFDDKRFDERRWAELVNAKMQTQSHYVTPSQSGFMADLDNLIWHQEEPFTTTSIFAQWCIMREARASKIPVLLDGQGADEVLCGYRKFTIYYLRDLVKTCQFGRLACELFGLIRRGDRGLLNFNDAQRYLPSWLRKRTRDASAYLSRETQADYAATQSQIAVSHTVSGRQKLDVSHFSVPSLLRYEDRNSMAFSVESRVPFLDYRLVDWAISLPTHIKITAGQSKAILRRAMRGTVPDDVLDRRDKMGFVTPQKVWMEEELGRQMKATFAKPELRIAPFVDAEALRADMAAYSAEGKTISDSILFRFFILEAWMERFDVTT